MLIFLPKLYYFHQFFPNPSLIFYPLAKHIMGMEKSGSEPF